MSRHRRRGRGQALAEFALVFPIFALLLFGLIDLGRYVFVTNSANQAAREAARAVSVAGWSVTCPTAADREECAKDVVASRFYGAAVPTAPADWTLDCFDPQENSKGGLSGCAAGDVLLVEFHATGFSLFTPIVAQLLPPPQVEGMAKVAFRS